MGLLKPNSYKIIGMQRDNSTSAFDSKFSFENKNIRITSTKDNTQLSIVNERGTSLITVKEITSPTSNLDILGTPIGYNIIDNELILFTTENNSEPTQSIDLRNYYKLSTFTIHIEDNILTINYDIDAVQNEDITINDGLNIKVIINIVNDDQTIDKYELTNPANPAKSGELSLLLPDDYALVSINKVYVYYASDINDLLHTNKLLYADYINKTIEKLEDVDVYEPIVHESILGLLNNKFPFYTSTETEFSDSTAVEPLIAEQLDMINGYTTREYERVNPNIITVVPDSYHTSDYNLYKFNTTTDTLDKTSNAFITTVNLISYNVVHFYRLKEIIDTTPINALESISISDFPPNVYPQSTGSFTVNLAFTGESDLVNKAVIAYFNRPGIRVTTIEEFNNETDTYVINFQTDFLVSSKPITLTVSSSRYPNVNCSFIFSVRDVFLHDYQTTVSNVFTVISDGTKSNELPTGFNGHVTENIPTVSSITQPTSTNGIIITNVNNVFNIEPVDTTITGYQLDFTTFTYSNGVFKQIIVEQLGTNPLPSEAVTINNTEEISTYTPGELFTIQVYATPDKTYSGPIVPTYNIKNIFQLVDHCAMIQTINGTNHIVHYFTFKVLSYSESTNTITFSIAPKEFTYITSIDIETNDLPPIVVEPKSISILKDNDFEIVLNEPFNLTGVLYPLNVDDDKNTINLIGGEELDIIETSNTLDDETILDTTFTSKINTVPTSQYLTMYSTYDESIYKEITYQIVKPYIHIITNNGIVLDEIDEIVFDSSGSIEIIYLDRTEDIKLNQDLVNEIETISIISNCETSLTNPELIEWFDITQDDETIIDTKFIGERLYCRLFCKDDITVERSTTLSIIALNNNTINFNIIITQTV